MSIPADLFNDVKEELRPIYRDVTDWFISAFMWLITITTALV